MTVPTRRQALVSGAALAAGAILPVRSARAATTKIRYLTSWFAEAEHGGYYQALATGLYAKEGLDVSIDMGGPQVNGLQLLAAGNADIIMGYDIQVMKAVEKGIPVVTVGTTFQNDLQGVMTHPDVTSVAGLKGHKILIASTSYATFWPWLKGRFGFTDEQAGPDTFNLAPFLADKNTAMQGYPASEPYEAANTGHKVNFFRFSDDGYPPYGESIITTRAFADKNPDAVRAFIKATAMGWKDYLVNPAPANTLIKEADPKQDDKRLAYAIDWIKKSDSIGSGDAKTMGICTITEARFKQTYDFMVASKLLTPETNWKAAFTTKFVDGLKILPA